MKGPDSRFLDHEYRCMCGEGMHVDRFHAGRLVMCPRCGDFVVVPRVSGRQAVPPDFVMRTERLRIGLATKRQWKELLPVYMAPENYAYEVVLPATPGEVRKALKKASFPSGFRKSRFLKLRVADKVDDRLIGTVTVSFRLPYYAVDLGFMVHHEFHRHRALPPGPRQRASHARPETVCSPVGPPGWIGLAAPP